MTFPTFPIEGWVYLSGYGISFAISLSLTITLIWASKNTVILKEFFERAIGLTEKRVNPFGGVAVVISFLATLWILFATGNLNPAHRPLLLILTTGVSMMFTLGLFDDIYHLPARFKLVVQIIIALLLYTAGFQIERIGDFELGFLSFLVTLLWIIGITNAINLVDGMDGLAGGIVFLSCVTLCLVYLKRDIIEPSFLIVLLGGSILGFLIFNFPPAKIILGDTGSLPLGLLVSLITLLPLNQGFTDEIYYLIPFATLLIPITDTTFAFFRRVIKGTSPFAKDNDHFHHRLERLKFSPLKSISILFSICLFFDLTALIPAYKIDLIPKIIPIYFIFIIAIVALLVGLLKILEKRAQKSPP